MLVEPPESEQLSMLVRDFSTVQSVTPRLPNPEKLQDIGSHAAGL